MRVIVDNIEDYVYDPANISKIFNVDVELTIDELTNITIFDSERDNMSIIIQKYIGGNCGLIFVYDSYISEK